METRKLDFARSCENLLDVGGVCGLAMEDIGGSEDKYPENVSTCDKYCQNKLDSLSFRTENKMSPIKSYFHPIDYHAK